MKFLKLGPKFLKLGAKFLTINPFDPYAIALINRMIAAGETPTIGRQIGINNCIISLRANGLFETQFDVLTITRAHAPASGLMNWIKNSSNGTAVNSPIFTTNIGYKTNAGKSAYINTNYNPTNDKVLLSQNDASFVLKESGFISGDSYHGTWGGYAKSISMGTGISNINGIYWSVSKGYKITGYGAVYRKEATKFIAVNDTGEVEVINTSAGIPNDNLFILSINDSGTPNYFVGTEEISELYGIGKQLSTQKYNDFVTIMDSYFNGATFTSYSKQGGVGDRTAIISVTNNKGINYIGGNTPQAWVNGLFTYQMEWIWYPTNVFVGAYINFDFGAGVRKVIDEAKYYGYGGTGVWKWQGSNDESTTPTNFSDIGTTFTIPHYGMPSILIQLDGNITGYRHYRLFGISGTGDANNIYEMEFRIMDA